MALGCLVAREGAAEVDLDVGRLCEPRAGGNVTKQLAVIATIFLPPAFVTSFFSQNFRWMVEHVDSGIAFLVFGIGVQLAAIAALVAYFERQGWF